MFFCIIFLDSTYTWYHMIFAFVWLGDSSHLRFTSLFLTHPSALSSSYLPLSSEKSSWSPDRIQLSYDQAHSTYGRGTPEFYIIQLFVINSCDNLYYCSANVYFPCHPIVGKVYFPPHWFWAWLCNWFWQIGCQWIWHEPRSEECFWGGSSSLVALPLPSEEHVPGHLLVPKEWDTYGAELPSWPAYQWVWW